MPNRDTKDMLVGGVLAAIGFWVAAQSFIRYELGTLSDAGPGLFPAALGVILLLFGCVIFALGFLRSAEEVEVDLRSLLWVAGGIAVFGLLVERFGIIPATLALTFVASLADPKADIKKNVVVSSGVCVLAYLVFSLALGMHLSLFTWRPL